MPEIFSLDRTPASCKGLGDHLLFALFEFRSQASGERPLPYLREFALVETI